MTVTAVIGAGGNGTRRRPITTVVPKALLPILNTPLLDYAIAECTTAHTDTLAVVYSDDLVATYLTETRPAVKLIHQKDTDGYGSGVPPRLAADLVGTSSLYFVAADDVVIPPSGRSLLADLVAAKARSGAAAVVAARYADAGSAGRYGVLDVRGDHSLGRVREKPGRLPPGEYLVYLGRVLADSSFLDTVSTLGEIDGEFRVTDAIHEYAQRNRVLVYPVSYDYYDCGGVQGWVAANVAALGGAEV